MGIKIKTTFLILTLSAFNPFSPILAEGQIAPNAEKNLEIMSEKNDIVPKDNENDLKSIKEDGINLKNKVESKSTTKSSKSENTTEKSSENAGNKKKSKNTDGSVLKNPSLIQEFKDVNYDDSPADHVANYLLYGLLSGGIMGFGGGLSFYTSSANLTPLIISSGAVGAAGAITGIIVALIENTNHNPLIGSDLLKYTWYGVVGGAMIGGLVGLIPYSSTQNTTSILNGIGYGSYAGIGVGLAMFFILPKSTLKNIILDINPAESKIGYKFTF